ncbi:MAG: valine--tRNA ligase [Chloroflexi bacterium]|nr:valine--tRNA ligase [Chloroflexota bacterium]MDA1218409.1 valine--tRNA ligase [Chloroflexota bacterium]
MTANAAADIPRAYNAADVEPRIYQNWMDHGYFTPSVDPNKKPYCIIMPPPNVTGELHLGHALTAAIEDALCRWHRMLGDSTLWLPGKDHAGIATQWVVERLLAQEGISRHDLGREKFVERVWEWVGKYGNTIDEQHKRLGASCDWSRLRFTLDSGPVKSVRTTFVNLYNKGLIYRHERIINWCPRCATALSDLEVEHEEQDGRLYHLRYPLADQPEAFIIVATTRPESMLGDTGVAVHPDDPRYKDMVGKQVLLPIMNRPIPIVADDALEMEFGTGALKVTPGHDPVDFEIGQRHGLEIINVIGFDGNMTDNAGKYAGMERFQARLAIVAELESLGLLEKIEVYRHSVGHCQRCDSVVEPLISLQWFLNVGHHDEPDSIAGRAHAAVANGNITVVPDRFSRVYLNWLENIRDWCISRQLWWGHRIPVWYCAGCTEIVASVDDPTQCPSCGSADLQQDPDVLDTWFSSGLWPHSTLGWPEDTDDLRYFYPTSVMETGYDILFFWIARMIMLGIENTGEIPFRTVYLHGLVRDAQGAKMSKTKGNTLDPLELIDQYGTDALRFALTTGTAPGNDLRVTDGKLESSRNFANKVWNAARYVMTCLDGRTGLDGWSSLPALEHREDRWIVSLLDRVTAEVNQSLESFELGEAQQKLYEFVWNDFCDWYIEMAKIRLRSGVGPSPLPVLAHVLERTLRLLHPFMPFITEEIWQNLLTRLPEEGDLPESIMIAPYPQAGTTRQDSQAEEEVALVIQTIRAVRNTRAQLHIPAGQRLEAVVEANGMQNTIEEEAEVIRTLSRVEPLRIVSSKSAEPEHSKGITLVVNPLVVRLRLEGVVDLSAEEKRLRSELDGALKNLKRVETLVSNPDFRAKARPEVVENEEERFRSLTEQTQRLEEILVQLGSQS